MAFSSSSTLTICPRYHEPQPNTAILHHNGEHGISFGQKAFITTILKRCHMQNAYEVSTPMVPNIELDIADDRGEKEHEKESVKHYHVIVGSLMYAAFATRPDISYALCRYNSRPFTSHMIAANRVLQYLNATAYFRLHFNGNGNGNDGIVGFTDSDWANDSTDRKSQGGHVIVRVTMVAPYHGSLRTKHHCHHPRYQSTVTIRVPSHISQPE
jgi:hypothetical protein